MKFGLALVLGILIFSAGIHGDLGSILACLIDPGALSEVTGSSQQYYTSDGQPPLTAAQTKALIAQQSSHPGAPASLPPNPDGSCPTGFAKNSATGQCTFVRTR